MNPLKLLIRSQQLVTLPITSTVQEAANLMAQKRIGCILVMENEKLHGIFTERDLLNRVVSTTLNPNETPLKSVMSTPVTTVSASESIESCYRKMQSAKCRHMPVTDNEKLIGVVSMRDILEWILQAMEEENVFLKQYIQS